jgi:hypothetical protein
VKLLIDECLSQELARLAQERGHHEASHVIWIGKGGWKDWRLREVIIDGSWTFVTKNSEDFRGPAESPGSKGQYAGVDLHAGLICLNGPVGMDLDVQLEMFGVALDELDREADLTNQIMEINLDTWDDDSFEIRRYRLPDD